MPHKMEQIRRDMAKITTTEMEEAITRSGYLIEQRVEAVIAKDGYYVETNAGYLDPETMKTREIDLTAMGATRMFRRGYHFIFPYILCECENNPHPIVFFTRKDPISFLFYQNVKYSGTPVAFFKGNAKIDMAEFLKFENFHHYCRGPHSTQYCGFHRKKEDGNWMAFHDEKHHDSFSSLMKAVESEIDAHYGSWKPPAKGEEEFANIQIYYPVFILQGDLYLGSVKRGALCLKRVHHVQFLKERVLPGKSVTYQIDVITEGFLRRYLKMIDKEMTIIRKRLSSRKRDMHYSMHRLVARAKGKRKGQSLREIFEP